MHAVVVKASIKDEEPARQFLQERVVPMVSQAPGFVAGYWVRLEGGDEGNSVLVFESEDAARTASEQVRANAPDNPSVELRDVSVGEVVANA